MENWVRASQGNIAISSRVRLARNLKDYAFPHKLSQESGREIVKKVEEAIKGSNLGEGFTTHYLWDMRDNEKLSYMEAHLISPKLINNSSISAFMVNEDKTISIMINEEDHIRLQVISGGLQLLECYEMAVKIDNLFEEKLDYAFDEKLGYITACPTNLGTALRASAMLHVPALAINRELDNIFNAVTKVGMTIRGLYGEGSKAEGDFFQVSNQLTLGISEEDILNNLNAVVNQIISREQWFRQEMYENHKYEFEDKVYRALGTLSSAVLLSSRECLNLLSYVRMGVEMEIINNIDRKDLNALLLKTQPANILQSYPGVTSERERDFIRAKIVRESINRN